MRNDFYRHGLMPFTLATVGVGVAGIPIARTVPLVLDHNAKEWQKLDEWLEEKANQH